MDPLLLELRQALAGDLTPVVDRWMAEADRRCWQLGQRPALAEELRGRCEVFLQSLAEVVSYSDRLDAGDTALREPVKSLSFIAGWLVGVDLPVSAGLALCHGLQATVRDDAHPFFQNLAVAAAESYLAGERERAAAQHRQVIKKSQLVCMLADAAAALLLVGDPEREALEDAVGRLMMLALMRAARYVLVDISSLLNPQTALPKLLELLASHREGLSERGARLLVTGLSDGDTRRLLPRSLPPGCLSFETLEQGLSWLRRAADAAPSR